MAEHSDQGDLPRPAHHGDLPSPPHQGDPAPPAAPSGSAPEAADRAKEACRELAQRLATPEGARAARALQRAGELRLPPPALALPGEPGAGDDAAFASGFPETSPATGDDAPRRARPISIWQPRGEGNDLVFVRPEPLPLGDHFAARREIRPKRTPLPLRVCLFGESAAAGYLYAPQLTPAGVLEAQLRAVAGEGAAEVIDLARTNETLGSLAATIEAAVQLLPDVLVIFAGNNWNLLETPEISPYAPSVAARQRYAKAWREGRPRRHSPGDPTVRLDAAGSNRAAGPGGPVALAADRLRAVVATTFERIALIAQAIGVPVVVVVPEVSLAGWESRQPVLWLSGGDGEVRPGRPQGSPVARWYRHLAAGCRHLERGAWAAAARSARQMLDLDGGANPSSWRLLARSRMGAGDEAAAAAAARSEIDAAAYPTLAFLGAPQATSLAKELLRETARRPGFALVDLPAVFAAHTGSPLPGRRLFLDYCHLTAEGIEVAMAAVASEVLCLSGIAETAGESSDPGACASRSKAAADRGASASGLEGAERLRRTAAAAGELGWRELLQRLPRLRVPPAVEAVARLGAAVHGAHRLLAVGPKAEILEAWCDAALDASPGIESAMLDLIAARASPLPALLTPAQARNLGSGYRLGLPHGWRWEHADADVVAAIVASLERHGRPQARAEADTLFLAGRGIASSGTELLDPPYYLWEPLERFYPDVMSLTDLPRPATLRSPWPETSLCLICDGARDIVLDITARLPLPPSPTPGEPVQSPAGARRRGTLRLSIAGQPAGSLPLSEAWSRHQVRLPSHLLQRGRNRLVCHWPMPAAAGEAALQAALARLDEGIAADLHPVFGELYSAVARPA